jgi:hypothetical protein
MPKCKSPLQCPDFLRRRKAFDSIFSPMRNATPDSTAGTTHDSSFRARLKQTKLATIKHIPKRHAPRRWTSGASAEPVQRNRSTILAFRTGPGHTVFCCLARISSNSFRWSASCEWCFMVLKPFSAAGKKHIEPTRQTNRSQGRFH